MTLGNYAVRISNSQLGTPSAVWIRFPDGRWRQLFERAGVALTDGEFDPDLWDTVFQGVDPNPPLVEEPPAGSLVEFKRQYGVDDEYTARAFRLPAKIVSHRGRQYTADAMFWVDDQGEFWEWEDLVERGARLVLDE